MRDPSFASCDQERHSKWPRTTVEAWEAFDIHGCVHRVSDRSSCARERRTRMKISLEWLSEYAPGALREVGAERAAQALMNGGLPVESIEPRGDDVVIDVEVTSNRSDCLSHVGVGRELAALLDRPFADLKVAPAQAGKSAGALAAVEIEAPALCPFYSARVIRGARVGPRPAWMVKRLAAIGVRRV